MLHNVLSSNKEVPASIGVVNDIALSHLNLMQSIYQITSVGACIDNLESQPAFVWDLQIHSFGRVFPCIAKARVIQQFEERFLKPMMCGLSLLSVKVYVGCSLLPVARH